MCFTGADSKQRAAVVGRVITAQKGEDAKSVATLEDIVQKMDSTSVLWLEQLLPEPVEAPARLVPGTVKKADDEMHIVWSEVYIPDFPDAHGDFMRAEHIRKMAHNFLAAGRVNKVDVQHDNVARSNVEVVESYIAKEGDPVFIPGSWVVGVRVLDEALWEAVKSGELNGFSMQAKVFTKNVEIEVDIPPEVIGSTERGPDPSTGHRHKYSVRFSDNGEFLGGQTDVINGHFHKIIRGSITAPPIVAATGAPDGSDEHHHRYTFLDKIFGVPLDSEARELVE